MKKKLLGVAGFILCSSLVIPLSAAETIQYSYDELGRLIIAKSTGSVNNNQTHSACFDPAGNRVKYKSNGTGGVASCGPITVVIDDAVGNEGQNLLFRVRLNSAAPASINVSYATAWGTAQPGDLVATSGTLTFAPGENEKWVTVQSLNNSISNPTKVFYVNLSNPTGGSTIADAQASGTIFDDDFCGEWGIC
jgi:hypothetical protein